MVKGAIGWSFSLKTLPLVISRFGPKTIKDSEVCGGIWFKIVLSLFTNEFKGMIKLPDELVMSDIGRMLLNCRQTTAPAAGVAEAVSAEPLMGIVRAVMFVDPPGMINEKTSLSVIPSR